MKGQKSKPVGASIIGGHKRGTKWLKKTDQNRVVQQIRSRKRFEKGSGSIQRKGWKDREGTLGFHLDTVQDRDEAPGKRQRIGPKKIVHRLNCGKRCGT